MDDLLSRLDQLDHYELLGISPDADANTLHRAWTARARRYDPSFAPPTERALFERALRAFDEAFGVLNDAARRQHYDSARRERASAKKSLSDFTWVAGPTATPSAQAPARVASAEVRVQPAADPRFEALNASFGRVLVEVERMAAAVHLLVAQSVEPGSVRAETLLAAAETLGQTRATLAAMQAEREEEAGRFGHAATLWQRVARQRPGDPAPFMRACDALRKGAEDLDGAEAMATKALEVDPDYADAHAAVAVIHAIRARRAAGPR